MIHDNTRDKTNPNYNRKVLKVSKQILMTIEIKIGNKE